MNEKKYWQRTLLSILHPLLPRFKNNSRIVLTGNGATYAKEVIELEAFARPLWGLVPFWLGGGRSVEFENMYLSGLKSGSDKNSEGYWGDSHDNDQRFVEMAPIAFAIAAIPEILWNPLDEKTKENLSSWLYQINEHEIPKCNWYFFRILVNTALRLRGRKYSEERLDSDLAFIESCYEDNGWYRDGVSGRHDYYSSFAMQFYSLLYSSLSGDDRLFSKKRAELFSYNFIYWFTEEGDSVPYGRSLTYRFAMCAFWSALAFCSIKSYKYSVIKGIIYRNITLWLKRDIFNGDGTLSVGFGYPNLTMAERYNAPGSPYWALKAFLFLAIPDNHPFWNSELSVLPLLNGTKKQAEMMIVANYGWDAVIYTPGMLGMNSLGHFTEKYDKFAYSALSPFSISHSSESIVEAAPDSMLSFVIDGNVYVRRGSIEYEILDNEIVSIWSPFKGIEVKTVIYIVHAGQIREHYIYSDVECIAYDAGFSCPTGGKNLTKWTSEVFCNDLHSKVENIGKSGEAVVIDVAPNTNLMWRNTKIPAIKHEIFPGRTIIRTKVNLWKE